MQGSPNGRGPSCPSCTSALCSFLPDLSMPMSISLMLSGLCANVALLHTCSHHFFLPLCLTILPCLLCCLCCSAHCCMHHCFYVPSAVGLVIATLLCAPFLLCYPHCFFCLASCAVLSLFHASRFLVKSRGKLEGNTEEAPVLPIRFSHIAFALFSQESGGGGGVLNRAIVAGQKETFS